MEDLWIEYAYKFRKIGCDVRIEMILAGADGNTPMYIVNVNSRWPRENLAGGGFREPLELFEYLDVLLLNYKNHGYLLPGGTILANPTP